MVLKLPEAAKATPPEPIVVFTVRGNPKSEMVLEQLRGWIPELRKHPTKVIERKKITVQQYVGDIDIVVLEDGSPEVLDAFYKNVGSPDRTVAVFDGKTDHGMFSMVTKIRAGDRSKFPSWAERVTWGVLVYGLEHQRHQKQATAELITRRALSCAQQIYATFRRHFAENMGSGKFPWGHIRKTETPPFLISLDPNIEEIIKGLNRGPDIRTAIGHGDHVERLPKHFRVSWNRFPDRPVVIDQRYTLSLLDAFREFEMACTATLGDLTIMDRVAKRILGGVDLENAELRRMYLQPKVKYSAVRRADLHYTGNPSAPFFGSELDEMPGGMPSLFHSDSVYGVNQESWKEGLDWLHKDGPLVFLVSKNWSRVYIPETEWLVRTLREKGYDTYLVTTDELERLKVTDKGILIGGGRPIGTIWRQFPIFETTGKLTEIVRAAYESKIRMVPEFSHFGNKAWFSVFRSEREFFRKHLSARANQILDDVLPDSQIVRDEESFPLNVAGVVIESLDEMLRLPVRHRNRLVLKVCGANTLAARSYGVFMDHDAPEKVWAKWINDRVMNNQPFIVQEYRETAITQMPVRYIERGTESNQLFRCRLLLRPFQFDNRLISVAGVAVNWTTRKAHGMVDMASLPIVLGEISEDKLAVSA